MKWFVGLAILVVFLFVSCGGSISDTENGIYFASGNRLYRVEDKSMVRVVDTTNREFVPGTVRRTSTEPNDGVLVVTRVKIYTTKVFYQLELRPPFELEDSMLSMDYLETLSDRSNYNQNNVTIRLEDSDNFLLHSYELDLSSESLGITENSELVGFSYEGFFDLDPEAAQNASTVRLSWSLADQPTTD